MKKATLAATAALTLALGASALAGCATEAPESTVNADTPAGAAPLMPSTHEGRYESLGAKGCYGCHGANDQADPMLTGSVPLPADHYQNGDPATQTMDPVREQCNTCHVTQGE
ncbi:nitrate reductase cytochrome c-type subunit [Rubneribacter sp.]|nr:hypothetical protein [Candidatus Rubneribacter avistercoris]